ncbi:MAG: cyclodeaminase/cyclohydrolase family protein [Spirochaetaceae bacterium]|nr:cyclodeaminase/cyclohydrolase family protein [Spirochaetaceae bacterium]
MKLIEQNLEDFSLLIASGSPVPGGGSGAALTAALGASFIAMVARITAGKHDFAVCGREQGCGHLCEHGCGQEFGRIVDKADKLRRLFLRLVDEDAAAYEHFTAAKETTAATAAASAAAAEALRGCVEPPLKMLEGAYSGLLLAQELAAAYYPPTASDIGIAALNLETAARGAYLTVHINLKHIKDGAFAVETAKKSRAILDRAEAAAAEIYASVKKYVET